MSHLAMLHLWMSEQHEVDIRTQQTENAEGLAPSDRKVIFDSGELASSDRETDLGGEELQAAEVTAFTPIDFFWTTQPGIKTCTYIYSQKKKKE